MVVSLMRLAVAAVPCGVAKGMDERDAAGRQGGRDGSRNGT